MTNQARAQAGRFAVLVYGYRIAGLEPLEPMQVLVCGLIRNLIHYCKQNDVDFEKAATEASHHFISDVMRETNGPL